MIENKPLNLTDYEIQEIVLLWAQWRAMNARCNNPKRKGYENYGGRGIFVCERWKEKEINGEPDFSRFINYIRDVWPRPEGKSLDRKDNDGPYDPSNVRWATQQE